MRRVLLDALMVGWGIGTWLGVSGLFVQLPLLVDRLPEGWALASSMVLVIQLANVGIIVYAILSRLLPRISEGVYIYGLLAIGTLALVLNAFLYDTINVIGGSERSAAFLALTFFAALVGCTSSVLFYPYLRHFLDIYLATYLVGEGLSGFIPSILALIQGVGGEPECTPSADNSTIEAHFPSPRFDTMVFLLLLGLLSAISLISFIIINNYGGFNNQRVDLVAEDKTEEKVPEEKTILATSWFGVLGLMMVLNALINGVMPSVQSYSSRPYGTRAHHLATTLGAMANPTACMAGIWLRPMPLPALAAMLSITIAPLCFILATALLSPFPPLFDSAGGEVLIVLCWILVTGVISYTRMWVYGWARKGGAKGMRACGAVTQLGSLLGSVVMYCLVNFTNLFVQGSACSPPSSYLHSTY
ncbi:unnamed protein product [Arctia plantaginis]|uniref:Riboflavin transporter n=1 Tax=Arctia plantaginis TaxID=874455 RepID=A0A8S1AW74_ARCPL|nr:unnamed protein product [Arctia plantaginis]